MADLIRMFFVTSLEVTLGNSYSEAGCGGGGRAVGCVGSGSSILDHFLDVVDDVLGGTDERQHVNNAELEVTGLFDHCVFADLLLGDVADMGGHDAVTDTQKSVNAVTEFAQAFGVAVLFGDGVRNDAWKD
jgi:hypothetical protein